jgi:hypothetical protein
LIRQILALVTIGIVITVVTTLLRSGVVDLNEYITALAVGLSLACLGIGYWGFKPQINRFIRTGGGVAKARETTVTTQTSPEPTTIRTESVDTEPVFESEIVSKKQAYERGKDNVYFRSKFRGYLTNGFFANLIFAPNNDEFENITENLSEDRHSVRSWCPETLDYWSDKGKVNGSVNTEWKYWNWKIPEFAPLGDCKVEMGVWNTLTDNKQPFLRHTDYIRIIDKDSSHYRHFNRVNTGENEFPYDR